MPTAPSSSATSTSPGKLATPPQAIGSFQPTNVSPLTDAGAAVPWQKIGMFAFRQPALSRITPSVTSAVTLRRAIRITKMSPKMPAVVTPIASATAMQPSGMASIAARVEIGLPQLSGVARSSRTGTKRSVKAGPTRRWPPSTIGSAPLIQQCRMPFFRSIVVMVAVVTWRRTSKAALITSLLGFSGGREPDPLVAAAQIVNERDRQQHHPGLADDLARKEFERAEGEIEEDDGVHHEPDQARHHHGGNQPPPRERGIDREIGELRDEERNARGQHQRRRRKDRGKNGAEHHGPRRIGHPEPPLHEVAQHQCDADH